MLFTGNVMFAMLTGILIGIAVFITRQRLHEYRIAKMLHRRAKESREQFEAMAKALREIGPKSVDAAQSTDEMEQLRDAMIRGSKSGGNFRMELQKIIDESTYRVSNSEDK